MAQGHPVVRDTAVLTIAGSDSSAGAGLLRDQRVLLDHGAMARVVITAVTAQSNSAVTAVHHVPPPIILAQFESASEEGCLGAVKIGMLGTEETVAAVVVGLQMLPALPIVLDPVLSSSSGTRLLSEGGQQRLLESLCPLVTLLTPNLEEAAMLLQKPLARTEQDVIAQASELRESLGCAVLIKGGHAVDQRAIDYLADGGRPLSISGKRIATSMRGTGCALSTAIAVGLARSSELAEACRDAKRYVESLLAAQALGQDK